MFSIYISMHSQAIAIDFSTLFRLFFVLEYYTNLSIKRVMTNTHIYILTSLEKSGTRQQIYTASQDHHQEIS